MNRIWRASKRLKRMKIMRGGSTLAVLCFVFSILLIGEQSQAAPTLRIAIAPFAGEQGVRPASAWSIAKTLAIRLSDRSIERLLGPGDIAAVPVFEPRASEVRRWAYNGAVDTIVVGRVFFENQARKAGPRVIEIILRSGHSGAEISRHDVVVPDADNLDRSIKVLADAILEDLGHVEPVKEDIPMGAPAAADSGNAISTGDLDGDVDLSGNDSSDNDSSGSGLDVVLSNSDFRDEAPIEIKADEAEIISRPEGRKLIFQRNVSVRQDNVTLRSDRLEASYLKGESEPRELIAEGQVQIVQNDRHAKCDRAVYLREANRLTCSGRAELMQGCDIIRGRLIEFDLAGDQARVEGAASIVIQPKEKEPTTCTKSRGQM
jgi:lipopolysaccharide transport protein LptA